MLIFLFFFLLRRYQESDLVKLDLLLNGQAVDALATIVHRTKAHYVGRELCEKLKKVLDRSGFIFSHNLSPFKHSNLLYFRFVEMDKKCTLFNPNLGSLCDFSDAAGVAFCRQMFEVAIQASIGSKVVARET